MKKIFIVSLICILSLSLIFYLNYVRYSKKLNVILITVDALRADHLGCYGYKRNTSPNIDKLAKEGVLFTQAIAQSSHTPASIGSIVTSTLPRTNLLINWGDSINPAFSTIAHILKTNGYRTICVSSNGNFLKGLHGFSNGFDIFYEESVPADIITNKALQFLIKYINKPFFMWIHYMEVHGYNPSKQFELLYINDRLYNSHNKLPIVKDILYSYGYNGIPESLAKRKDGVDNPDYYIAQYDGAIRTIDEQIGILLDKLKQHGIDRKTLIIFTADHGEMLGEHDYYFHHGWFLYEPLIKVPLIIKCNEIIPQNKVIDDQISASIDITPTILDILKIKKVSAMEGVSLLAVVVGKNKYPLPYLFADEGHTTKCIRTNEWKLIYTELGNKRYELYNLKDDPKELHNLVSVEKEKFEFLRQKLDEYKWASFQDKKAKSILDEDTKKRLKSLGYVQ